MSSFDQSHSRPQETNEGHETAAALEAELDNHRAAVLIRKLAADRLPKSKEELDGLSAFMLGELDHIKEDHPRLYEAADDMVAVERGLVENFGEETATRVMGEVSHAHARVAERHRLEAETSGGDFNIDALGVYGEALQEVALRPGFKDFSTELFGSLFAHRLAEIRLGKAAPAYLNDVRSR